MVLHRPGALLLLEERPIPRPSAGEVLVRVVGAGVCGSDLHMADGDITGLPLPRVLGHEIAGQTAEFGEVLVFATWGDGTCRWCRQGLEQLCPDASEPGWAVDGGFAEYLLVPDRRFLVPLEGLDPVRAAPLADAGLTSYRAVRRTQPWLTDTGSTAVVIGAGGLGQFAIQYVRLLTNARVIAVDTSAGKRERAVGLGAHEAVDTLKALPRATAILDFVGTDSSLAFDLDRVLPTGVVVVVGEAGGRVPFGFGAIPHEANLTTSVWGSIADLHDVLDLARRDKITWEVEALSMERANEALERLRKSHVTGRIVLVP